MKFQSLNELKLWLFINKIHNFDAGSQGECYKIGNSVYKIFTQFIYDDNDNIEYNKKNILQFSNIKNDTYIWPTDVIMVDDMVVGYITPYVKAKSLCKINPLLISLSKFEKSLQKAKNDVKIISDNGVSTFDVCYNVMYGINGFKIIDSMEYSLSDQDSNKLFEHNLFNLSYEIKMFLVDNYFDHVIDDSVCLKKMYDGRDVDAIEFLKSFRDRLCEIEDKEILSLGDAKNTLSYRKRRIPGYIRNLD